MIRTFIAIDLPPEVLDALAVLQTQVREHLRARALDTMLRWSMASNLHITLRFLGDTTEGQRSDIVARLVEVAATTAPFTLKVDASGRALGGFPTLRQPRVLWTGVEGDLTALHQLQHKTEVVARAAGFTQELKDYSPHLTLARASREASRRALGQVGRAVEELVQLRKAEETSPTHVAPMTFPIERFVFYQSELRPGGSRYTPLATVPLLGV